MAENMNMNQNQAQKQPGVVSQIKGMLAQDNIKLRFNDVLGKKAPQFMASIVNVVLLPFPTTPPELLSQAVKVKAATENINAIRTVKNFSFFIKSPFAGLL